MKHVGFIGFGRMGQALATGAVFSGALKKNQVLVCDPFKARSALKQGFKTMSIAELISRCDTVFLCIKPQKMEQVLSDVKTALTSKTIQKICLVSIAAGVPLARIQKSCGHPVSLFRVMPNTPALLKAGMSALAHGPKASAAQEKFVITILKSVGVVAKVPEKFMDAITALSGSGPAYVFYLAEGLMKAAVSLGLSRALARLLIHQTLFGSGLMLKERPETADQLRHQVTSPGGTTAAAISEFEKRNFLKIVESAVKKAAQRSAQLAKI